MLKTLQRLFRRPPGYQIDFDATRVLVSSSGGESFSIPYDSITSVTAYKRDLLTEDLICLSVSYVDAAGGGSRFIEVNEEMAGFEGLTIKLAEALSGFDLAWREKVVKPAFSENKVLLYQRPASVH